MKFSLIVRIQKSLTKKIKEDDLQCTFVTAWMNWVLTLEISVGCSQSFMVWLLCLILFCTVKDSLNNIVSILGCRFVVTKILEEIQKHGHRIVFIILGTRKIHQGGMILLMIFRVYKMDPTTFDIIQNCFIISGSSKGSLNWLEWYLSWISILGYYCTHTSSDTLPLILQHWHEEINRTQSTSSHESLPNFKLQFKNKIFSGW